MKIEVTQEDIETKRPCDKMLSECCPLARAISRAFGEEWHVGVHRTWRSGDNISLCLPPEAIEFREAYDVGQHVEPFTFELC